MRKTVRVMAEAGPERRLARAIAQLPAPAQHALLAVADREDLPLVSGTWGNDAGGCLVANVVATLDRGHRDADATLDLRLLALLPELSSRDLNRIVIAWDEAAAQEGRSNDAALRRLLRNALAQAGVTQAERAGAPSPAPAGGSA